MVNHKTGKGVSIIEQVRNMLHAHQIYSNNLEPALENISNTCADALAAYQRVLEERDDGTLLENSNQLLTSQRDLARSDNVRLNKLIDQLYHATEIFKSPANINSSENTFNWGWARKTTNKNYPIYNKKSPFFQYPSNEYDDKHDKDTTTNSSETPNFESENATSESKIGVNIPFSYFTEADTAEISNLSISSVPFMPRKMTTVTNSSSSNSQQFGQILDTSKILENADQQKVDEKIEMGKSPRNIIINENFKKIKIRNPNAGDISKMTYEPLCSESKSSEDTLQHSISENSIGTPLKNIKVNHEEIDSLNDSLSDSSPREIFQKGKGRNLTKQGVKPTLNRKDLDSPRSHARLEQKKCFYTKKLSEASLTLNNPSHTQRSTSSAVRKYIYKGLLPTPKVKPIQQFQTIRKMDYNSEFPRLTRNTKITQQVRSTSNQIAFSIEEQDDEWLIDSACSMHMTGRLEFLRDYREVNFGGYVTFGNDANGIIKGYGVLTNGNFTIQKVAYVLGLKHNLISVGQLVSTGLRVEFDNEFSYIMTGTRDRCLIRSSRQINMFPLDITMCPGKPRLCLLTKAYSEISWLWHRKLAHLNFRYMNQLVTEEMVRGLPLLRFDNENLCAACAFGKQKKKPHKTISDSSITRPLELLHMDLYGPSTVASINHKKYILVIVDDYSRFTWVFFLRLKSDTFTELKNFITSIELKIQLPVRRIRSDNGTEFNNKLIEEFLTSKGIEHNFSAPYTPQQNGVVERRNRTLVEAARSMLNFANLPLTFWAEAISTASFVQNRSIINKRLKMTPYEVLNKRKLNVKFFHIFGCRCFIKNNKDHLGKFAPKSDEAIFMGYSPKSVAYRVLNKRTRVIEESFDIEFDDQYQWRKKNQDILYVMENDVPVGHRPIHTVEIDYDLLFDTSETAKEAEVIHSPDAIQQIISTSGPTTVSETSLSEDQANPPINSTTIEEEPQHPSSGNQNQNEPLHLATSEGESRLPTHVDGIPQSEGDHQPSEGTSSVDLPSENVITQSSDSTINTSPIQNTSTDNTNFIQDI
ncbi:hypothetical protein L1887_28162 [Cichorium endivia]|nr:hypothetical protein L1887_28162 [Cichorium endivia]